jgi:hypothetical protein
MVRSGFIDEISPENSLETLNMAFERAKKLSTDACKVNVGS